MSMKEFKTAAKKQVVSESGEKVDTRESMQFKHDDTVVTCYRPSESQVGLLVAVQSGGVATDDEYVATIIDFFQAQFDEDSARYFKRRLLDGKDDFELEDMNDILTWMLEEWAQRPTKPSSDSTLSPQSSGDGSTETSNSEASSSSSSRQLAPAT